MTKKILLLDGLSIANRAYYGIPLLTNSSGQYTNAVYGFLNIMLSMIEKEKPDAVGVAFDVSAPTFRHKQFEAYKGTRKGMPSELRSQIPLIKEILQAMGIYQIQKEGYEADDLLGTLAKKGEASGHNIVIVSGDKDLLQLTTDSIQLKIPKTKLQGTEVESYYAKDVFEKYEVSPNAFIDVKGMMGDPSDNIPGVPGIGEKTAIKLIKQFGSIENIYENIDSITQKKLHQNLVEYKEQAFMSKELATIICDVPIEEVNWEDLDYDLTLEDEAYELLKTLELKKILQRLPKKENGTIEETFTEKIWTSQEATQYVKAYGKEGLACTYEVLEDEFKIAFSNGKDIGNLLLSLKDEQAIKDLKSLFENQSYLWIIHDSKAFRHILDKLSISINGKVFDTLIAAYLMKPTDSTYTVEELFEFYLNLPQTNTSEKVGFLYKLYEFMTNQIKEMDMEELFYTIEMPLVEVLFDMEKEGIKVDKEGLKAFGATLDERIQKVEKEVYEAAGETFNINSPKQLGSILFEKMGIPPIKKTKTGYSTAADVLEKLQKEYPIVDQILEYRQYVKLKSTYVDGLLQLLTKEDKIHTTYNQTVTATGRISSTEPNLQNIPIRMELGRQIRKVFIPRSDDFIFLDADYSQIELRVLAAIAKDETMIKGFKENLDIHTLTASQVFHAPFDEVTPLQRSNAKAVNFGIVYGIGAFSLSEDLKISTKEAEAYIEGYFEKYPAIKTYLDQSIAFAKMHGYAETLFNRRREIPEIQAKNFNLREFGKRVAMNMPIQGTAADIIKIAMIRVHKALKEKTLRSRLILTVHDELLLEVYKPEIEEVSSLLKYEMEHAVNLVVPLSVEVHSGKNWYEAK